MSAGKRAWHQNDASSRGPTTTAGTCAAGLAAGNRDNDLRHQRSLGDIDLELVKGNEGGGEGVAAWLEAQSGAEKQQKALDPPMPPVLLAWVEACGATDPAERPDAAEAAEVFRADVAPLLTVRLACSSQGSSPVFFFFYFFFGGG